MSKRIKFLLGIGVIAALVIGFQVAAFAVHDTGVFQLDGNATTDASPPAPFPGDDWDRVCHQVEPTVDCGTTTGAPDATATSWVSEPNRASTIFTGGGSKDPEDIPNWAWKDGAGGLPDKDNLRHAFAARYDTAEGDVLFFGSDRFDNSGDAHQAFWFLQDEVSLGDIKTGGGFNFNGVHTNGDLLVISNFSNGGTSRRSSSTSGTIKSAGTSSCWRRRTTPTVPTPTSTILLPMARTTSSAASSTRGRSRCHGRSRTRAIPPTTALWRVSSSRVA